MENSWILEVVYSERECLQLVDEWSALVVARSPIDSRIGEVYFSMRKGGKKKETKSIWLCAESEWSITVTGCSLICLTRWLLAVHFYICISNRGRSKQIMP